MGKVAFITGSTRGIGKQIALTLAKERIWHCYKLQKRRWRAKCLAVQGDVSKFEDCERFIKEIIDFYGKIDVLVNNAGITKDTLLARMKKEDFESVINVNLNRYI